VTVVIPTSDRACLVVEAIESVLRQSYRDLEVVVTDDGSTDGTPACVRAFGTPVRYLRLARGGRPGRTRNHGIEVARGELIAFLDDDDLWETDKLARQIELMDREGLNLVYTGRRVLFGDGSQPDTVISPAPASPDRLLDVILQGHFPSLCTLLVRKDLLQQINGFDETLATGEDLDLYLRLAPIARAGGVPSPLVLVRRQVGSLSDRSGPLAFRNAIQVLERWLARHGRLPAHRWMCRETLAHLQARLAVALAGRGDFAGAVHAALQAVRCAPASRTTWGTLARALSAWTFRLPKSSLS
jgi:glycosyltransferase involved in cell wall biosynthesis